MSWHLDEFEKTVAIHDKTGDGTWEEFVCKIVVMDSPEGDRVLRLMLAAEDLLEAAIAASEALKQNETGVARLYLDHAIAKAAQES